MPRACGMNGCNYFGKSTIRSAPFAIFHRQDILTGAGNGPEWKSGLKEKYHAKLLEEGKIAESFQMPDSIIPEIYGTSRRNQMEHCIPQRHSVPAAACVDLEFTWRKDLIGSICCTRKIRKSGIT